MTVPVPTPALQPTCECNRKRDHACHACHARRRQRGASAVEFALVFPLFFMIFYAIVTFSLIFVAQQSLTLAAEEGARAALNYQQAQTVNAALDNRTAAACTAAANLANWLAAKAKCDASWAPCTFDGTMRCVTVTLTYNYQSYPLVPPVPLFDVALPAQLTSSAMVQLNPGYVL
ncbi:TadE/TadG family type IV pilus assembly protein [Paraburkholderia caribensis]|uniref:TadE/TadG family type IV pilus assembly protein n=1 Tax=Paraburkholderia caribensis TaxID=75105 RepID=UPI001D094E08|nr:TadE family protein [Paraburkholderia caribensis]